MRKAGYIILYVFIEEKGIEIAAACVSPRHTL
jgi:hypothetical protein